MNTPDQKNDNFHEQMNFVYQKYGQQEINSKIAEITDRLNKINHLNARLPDIDTDKDSESYNMLVTEILTATQNYYHYIGNVPEDIRKVILRMIDMNDEDAQEEADTLREYGINMPRERSSLLSMQAIRPKNYIMQIDVITNQLAFINDRKDFTVGRRGKQPITTTVTLDLPEHMKIEGGQVLSTYDKSIINGVTSLLESGNTVFSIPMLYHAMTGRQNPTVDENLHEEIATKLEKMRRMLLSIDLSQESEAQYITDEDGNNLEISNLTIEGYLLPLNKVSGVINGKKAELYQIIQHPPLYSYSKLKRQLASVKISLLGAPVNNNSTTIPLKTYLLQRIELMKNKKNKIVSSTILFEAIYQELGAGDANKTKKMRIRNYTAAILDYFISQEYIAGYSEFRKGRSVAGIHIELVSGQTL